MLGELNILMKKHRLTDLSSWNIHFTEDGKLAIVDTEYVNFRYFNFTIKRTPEFRKHWSRLIKNGPASAIWPYKRT